jgi:DNA polymerase III, gamma/tau subunits
MTFAQLPGNDDVKQALAGMVDAGRVPHAILFHEDDGGGAFPLALAFLQYLYCRNRHDGDSCGVCPSCGKIAKLIHPDVHFVFPTAASELSEQYLAPLRSLVAANPAFREAELSTALGIEGKNSLIAVRESRRLLEKLSLSALEGGYRAVVIYLPERLNVEAANRLLKIIEEPPVQTQFLLITHQPERVLTTISSRCQRIRVCPVGGAAGPVFGDAALLDALMDALLARNLPGALEAADRIAGLQSREQAKSFCTFASDRFRQVFLAQQGVEGAGEISPQARAWAARCRKTFPRQALEVLNRTQTLIGRNVNLKILFTDMADRLYLQI